MRKVQAVPREVFFAANGFGPYECVFCKEPVLFEEVLVHHVDENRLNNDETNLAPAHDGCHKSFHRKGNKKTSEAISAALTGRTLSPEHRANISKARRKKK